MTAIFRSFDLRVALKLFFILIDLSVFPIELVQLVIDRVSYYLYFVLKYLNLNLMKSESLTIQMDGIEVFIVEDISADNLDKKHHQSLQVKREREI